MRRQDINYLQLTIESYDGMAMVRTVDPQRALIQLHIAPGCEDLLGELIQELREKEGISIDPAEQ